jgi:hypothetical protein
MCGLTILTGGVRTEGILNAVTKKIVSTHYLTCPVEPPPWDLAPQVVNQWPNETVSSEARD